MESPEFIDLGGLVIFVPGPVMFQKLNQDIRRVMDEDRISETELLEGLSDLRIELYEERYG